MAPFTPNLEGFFLAIRMSLDKRTKIERRQAGWTAQAEAGIIVAVVIVSLMTFGLFSYILLRYLRIKNDNPNFIPGAYLKCRWRQWQPSPVRDRSARTLQDRQSIQELRRTPSPGSALNTSSRDVSIQDEDGIPDRRTSLRSVMTLPSYTVDAGPAEKVLGRQGERGGIDTVVEFPETAEDEDERRNEEMESLYQIRTTRRQERQDREERRRLREAARTAGDTATLEQMRIESQQRASVRQQQNVPARDAAAMLAEHQRVDRGRRISSVSYMDLGVARHDGSRIRADSNDSDRPLLDDAKSSASRRRSQPRSVYQAHLHNQSTSSLRFMTPDYSDEERGSSEFDFTATPWGGSRRPSSSVTNLHHGADLGDGAVPLPEPPHYDSHLDTQSTSDSLPEAPPYESPTSTQAPRLAPLSPLPTIEVAPFTPMLAGSEPNERPLSRET